MWSFGCTQSLWQQLSNGNGNANRKSNISQNMGNIEKEFQITKSLYHVHVHVHHLWCLVIIGILYMPNNINAFVAYNNETNRFYMPIHYSKGGKYTIDDLLNGQFSYKISDDIDMDPCKASEFYNLFFLCFFFSFFSFFQFKFKYIDSLRN